MPPLQRTFYACLGRSYALMRNIQRRSILGIRLLAFVRWLPLLVLFYGWLARWPSCILVFLAFIILWLNLALWHAGRTNYNRFIAGKPSPASVTPLDSLPANRKITVAATGLFSVSGHEDTLLLRPAEYWRVPLGDHVVMVQERPGKFLYQFFSPESLQEIRSGWLLHGPTPIETIAVTFLARWGPEYTRFGRDYDDRDDNALPPAKRITIYLSPTDVATRSLLWHSITGEAHRS